MLKSWWKSFWRGFASIGEGMASFTIFPAPLAPFEPFRFKTFEDDAKALQSDWQKVLTDQEIDQCR